MTVSADPDWRAREHGVFQELKRLRCGGQTPDVGALDVEGARRAGYLAEFTALLLPGGHSERLLAWADEVHTALRASQGPAEDWPMMAAVPGAPPKPSGEMDTVARNWRVSPALARDRYLSEEDTVQVRTP